MTLFERIIQREIPADIVWEDDLSLAFRDIHPVAPVHVLVIPKEPLPRIGDMTEEQKQLLGHLMWVTTEVARKLGVDSSGYRVVTNNGDEGGQSVDHLHFHVLGGRQMQWPPG